MLVILDQKTLALRRLHIINRSIEDGNAVLGLLQMVLPTLTSVMNDKRHGCLVLRGAEQGARVE